MNEAINEFERGTLTDEGLLACLKAVDYGKQYVLKTDFACSKVQILTERNISYDESKEIEIYAVGKREDGKQIVDRMIRKYRNTGLYLDQLLESLQQKNENKEEEEYER
jgi:hypothetical protein